MAQALRVVQMTPADELRELLSASEKLVANLRWTGVRALDLLLSMDRIAALWPALEANGIDLRPEAGRWETLQATLHRNAGQLLYEARAVGGLPAARAVHHADGDAAWWWYLAEETRKQAWRRWRTAAEVSVAVIALGVGLVFLFNRLFPVDPNVRAAATRLNDGQQKAIEGADLQSALADFEAAAALTPTDAEPWLWLGATHEKLGQGGEAQEAYRKAAVLLKTELGLRLARTPIFLALGMSSQGQADLTAILALDPENAEAYYYLAGVYESQEQYSQAVAALERASALAEARKQVELTAMARYRMAMMMQQMQVRSLQPTSTPTP